MFVLFYFLLVDLLFCPHQLQKPTRFHPHYLEQSQDWSENLKHTLLYKDKFYLITYRYTFILFNFDDHTLTQIAQYKLPCTWTTVVDQLGFVLTSLWWRYSLKRTQVSFLFFFKQKSFSWHCKTCKSQGMAGAPYQSQEPRCKAVKISVLTRILEKKLAWSIFLYLIETCQPGRACSSMDSPPSGAPRGTPSAPRSPWRRRGRQCWGPRRSWYLSWREWSRQLKAVSSSLPRHPGSSLPEISKLCSHIHRYSDSYHHIYI